MNYLCSVITIAQKAEPVGIYPRQVCISPLSYDSEGESTVEKNGITELGQGIIIGLLSPPC